MFRSALAGGSAERFIIPQPFAAGCVPDKYLSQGAYGINGYPYSGVDKLIGTGDSGAINAVDY